MLLLFFLIEKSEEANPDEFSQNAVTAVWFSLINVIYKMETQKFLHLLNDSDNESTKFATRKSYVINGQNRTNYGEENGTDEINTFETKVIKSSLSDYSYAYIFVTGDITTTGGNAYSNVAFRNCAPFTRCVTHINDEHIDTADNLNITMPI